MSDTERAATDGDASSSHDSDARHPVNHELLDGLRSILEEQRHLFACGGGIPIREPNKSPQAGGQIEQIESDHFLCQDQSAVGPRSRGSPPGQTPEHSLPATFGRGGQDIYDESYRKALQMDPTAFCTTFDPYSVGIIDAVAQVLLPSAFNSSTHRSVRAELYKLNVTLNPPPLSKSGSRYILGHRANSRHMSMPHVLLRSLGLVVCLPLEHQGGNLKVYHKEQEMTFDWSSGRDNPDPGCFDHARIHWAAFYSDCEQEVLEVTSGHRLTLTYNLYGARGAGRLTGVSPTLNPANLPLYRAVKETMSQDPFAGQDGTLGFWCSHVYAYNHTTETPLPATLKGVDAVLWESFQALNLDPQIAPVIKMEDNVRDMFSQRPDFDDDPELSSYPWAIHRRRNQPLGVPSEWIAGYEFGIHVDPKLEVETALDYDKAFQRWGSYMREPVHWFTKPGESEVQLLYTAVSIILPKIISLWKLNRAETCKKYGNQATTEANCAILVNILPHEATAAV
ncbi:hypothetical protein QQS21_007943 [Conoideocrella luteorostrata]|uniref:Uncharacterized protein n=1 Tax=Conoideocrella luteorostrata TaxID=1105319 RepID=A0AAJ0FRX1_9HYPO|nr:hypothetical protein QQS21_007943 [Conoideocrella luteorostrata]